MNTQVFINPNRLDRVSSQDRLYLDEVASKQAMSTYATAKFSSGQGSKEPLKKLVLECGLKIADFPTINLQKNNSTGIIERFEDIDFTSRYQHQFGILDGTIHLAYIPHRKVISLSDTKKVIEFFCQKAQDEDGLTQTIFKCLQILLQTKDVMVSTESAFFGIHSPTELNAISVNRSVSQGGTFRSETYPAGILKS